VRVQINGVAKLGIVGADLVGRTLHVPKSELNAGDADGGETATPKRHKHGSNGSIQPNHQECKVKSYDKELQCFLVRVPGKSEKSGSHRHKNAVDLPQNSDGADTAAGEQHDKEQKETLHWLDLAEMPVWLVFKRGEVASGSRKSQRATIEPIHTLTGSVGGSSEFPDAQDLSPASTSTPSNPSHVQLSHSPIAHINTASFFANEGDNVNIHSSVELSPQKHLEALPLSTSNAHLDMRNLETGALVTEAGPSVSDPLADGRSAQPKILADRLVHQPAKVLL
jgi:hypothetical protein